MGLPHHPTRRGRRGSAPPSRPARAFRRGVRAAGLRARESHEAAGDSSAGMASRAGLWQPSSACGRSRAGLRQPGSAPVAPASAPPAPRSASLLRHPRPVAVPTCCALRPASLPPIGSTPSAPASAVRALTRSSGAWGGGVGRARIPRAAPAPRRGPGRRPGGCASRPHDPRLAPSAEGPQADRAGGRATPHSPRTTCGGTPRASRARRRPPPCPGASRRPCPARWSRRRSRPRCPRREGPRP